jgi:hypothetical protein
LGRRARRREHEAAEEARPARSSPPATRTSRSEAKNAAARAKLEPLTEGERPRAVTIAAVVALALALGNLIAYAAGAKIGHRRPAITGVASYSILMAIAAWGMWRAKYWAVLGMQAILGILILIFAVLLVTASNVTAVLVSLAVIGPSGALFWFLVKSLARIQMPDRRPR